MARAAHDLLAGDINSTLRQMTVSLMWGMATMMTFNLVDTLFVSRLGTHPLAAISFTFPVSFFLISLTIGLGIGTSAVIGHALGRRCAEQAKEQGNAAIWLGVLLVAVLAILAWLLQDPIFSALGASAEQQKLIAQYMNVWFAGSPMLAIPMIANAVMRANGDTVTPSRFMVLGGIINAVMDPVLIFGLGPFPRMELAGAALATVLAWLGGSVGVLFMLYKRQLAQFCLPGLAMVRHWRSLLVIGLPAAGANMMTPLAMAALTAMVAQFGPAAVAAYGVGSRLESLSTLVVLALSMSLPPFISQNMGAGQLERVRSAYKGVVRFVLGWQGLFYVALLVLAFPISWVFGKDPKVAEYIRLFIFIVPLGYGLQGVVILTNSSFNAIHRPAKALTMSVLRFFAAAVPLAWLGGHFLGLPGFFAGVVLANLISATIAYRWFTKETA
ncbi:MAG: MATE family efflux transporter [Pseudomonadota bacterium]|uniref:MATE family efflux transporter n=1 Tax=Gallaecimonas pentaromativorans TaxID=584787 RepID=UPI00067F6623|nr:MATE family efflux transporter [Gallaecimonas pentaromativorans]MED5524308.1 MATE family efflux transporter [Pseudomonadota bacterium]